MSYNVFGGSFTYDGYKGLKNYYGDDYPYGEKWCQGDVIGTRLDLEHDYIAFWRNDNFLGFAFTAEITRLKAGFSFVPCINLTKDQHVLLNFGEQPFYTQKKLNMR